MWFCVFLLPYLFLHRVRTLFVMPVDLLEILFLSEKGPSANLLTIESLFLKFFDDIVRLYIMYDTHELPLQPS